MKQNVNEIQEYIKLICKDKKIDYEELSCGLILKMKKNNITRYMIGQKLDLNKQAASYICSDKYATYSVMKSANISIIEHKILFNPKIQPGYIPSVGNYNVIKDYFEKNNNKLVVKSNFGGSGKDVYLCEDIEEVNNKVNYLFEKENSTISICPYYNIKVEYRNVYLNGKCVLTYGKVKDEKKSWKCNIASGAKPFILEDENLKKKLQDMAIKAGNALNLEFATVDIIQTVQNELYIIEINSSVCLTKFAKLVDNGEKVIYDVYAQAIDELFK